MLKKKRLAFDTRANASTARRSYPPSCFFLVRVLCSVLVAVSGALVGLAVAGTPAWASGTIWYAAVGGSGTSCTSGSPCTLTEALSSATTGDTVDLAAGTYQPVSDTSFTISTSITVQPTTPGSTVILQGNGATVLVVDSSVTATVSGVTVEDGDTSSEGGGISNNGTLTLQYSTIANNTDEGGSGGISSQGGGALTVEDSTVSGNNGGDGYGGGISNSDGPLIVQGSIISGNTAGEGGGIFSVASLTVEDSTIANNTAEAGAGIASSPLIHIALTVEDSTISGNTATESGRGGGIFFNVGGYISPPATLTLAADIFAGQSSGGNCDVGGAIVFTDAGYNVDDDGSCGLSPSNDSVSDSPVIDDYLGSLGSNGGTTETVPLLATPSPTTGSADPALAVIPSTFDLPVAVNGVSLACSVPDQRGLTRGQPCDIGAFELGGSATVTFEANGGLGSMAPEDDNAPTALTTNAFTRSSYTFSGWNTATDGTGTAYVNDAVYAFTANTTLYAQWSPNSDTVTYLGNGATGGSVPVDGSSPYSSGNTVTVLGNTGSLVDAGYSFDGWNTLANGTGTAYAPGATFTILSNTTLYAQWTANPALSFGSLTVTSWTVNQAGFTGTIVMSGGTSPYTLVSQSGLPTGLTAVLSGSTISFTGTPTAVGTFGSSSVTVKDSTGDTATDNFSVTIEQATTSLNYTGTDQVAINSSFTATATLTSPAPSCERGQPVTFIVEPDPLNVSVTSLTLGPATSSTTPTPGLVSLAVSTKNWANGVYTITASFAGTANCIASTSPMASLAVTSSGQFAFGGGWYNPSATEGATSFGFIVAQGPKSTYSGQLNVVTSGKWWFQANVTSFGKTSTTQALLAGTGSLYSWNSTLNKGHGGWQLVKSNVTYKATANAATKTTPASFGILINSTASGLPNSMPVALTQGAIFIT